MDVESITSNFVEQSTVVLQSKPRQSVRDKISKTGSLAFAQDFGLLILSTSTGVMNHFDAKDARIGGKLLAYVY